MNVVEGEPCLSVKAAQLKQPTSVFYSMATLLDNTSQNRMRAKSKKGRGEIIAMTLTKTLSKGNW